MALLRQHKSQLIIGVEDLLILGNLETNSHKKLRLPEVIVPPNLSKGQEDVLKQENKVIMCMCFSRTGSLFAVSTQNKQVVVYSKDFEVVKNFTLNRVASKIRFTPTDDILVADKTGDAFLYKLNSTEPELILGHLSMLLDALISDCGKYIVTCDRDEKIRVSCYPNAYNIVSYCLGHREFVTNVEMCGKVLISASGDGTLQIWNYLTGKQVDGININEYIEDKKLLEDFSMKMDTEKVEIHALPVTDMQVSQIGETTIVAATVLNYNSVLVFMIDESKFKFLQNVPAEAQLITFSLMEKLIMLTSNGFQCYDVKNAKISLCNNVELINDLYSNYKSTLQLSYTDNINILYKRKYDNVQEYLERKKLRLEMK